MEPPPPSSVDPATVFDVLADQECRDILLALDAPATADEIADATGTSASTLYRKLADLQEVGLLGYSHRLTTIGRHPRQYERRFDRLSVVLDATRGETFDVAVSVLDGPRRDSDRDLVGTVG